MAESAFEKWYEHYSIRSKWATAESEIARELMRDAWNAALKHLAASGTRYRAALALLNSDVKP